MEVKAPHIGFKMALGILNIRDNWKLPSKFGLHVDPIKGMNWYLRINGFEDAKERDQIIRDWILWGPPARDYHWAYIMSGNTSNF